MGTWTAGRGDLVFSVPRLISFTVRSRDGVVPLKMALCSSLRKRLDSLRLSAAVRESAGRAKPGLFVARRLYGRTAGGPRPRGDPHLLLRASKGPGRAPERGPSRRNSRSLTKKMPTTDTIQRWYSL